MDIAAKRVVVPFQFALKWFSEQTSAEKFACAICGEIPAAEVFTVHSDCGTVYCVPCLMSWMFTSGSCGKCNKTIEGPGNPADAMLTELNALRLMCPFKDCKWTGELRQFPDHFVAAHPDSAEDCNSNAGCSAGEANEEERKNEEQDGKKQDSEEDEDGDESEDNEKCENVIKSDIDSLDYEADVKEGVIAVPEGGVEESEDEDENEEAKRERPVPKKKAECWMRPRNRLTHEMLPKKELGAFGYYMKTRRQTVFGADPEMDEDDFEEMMMEEWRALGPEKRDPYQRMAEKETSGKLTLEEDECAPQDKENTGANHRPKIVGLDDA